MRTKSRGTTADSAAQLEEADNLPRNCFAISGTNPGNADAFHGAEECLLTSPGKSKCQISEDLALDKKSQQENFFEIFKR